MPPMLKERMKKRKKEKKKKEEEEKEGVYSNNECVWIMWGEEDREG